MGNWDDLTIWDVILFLALCGVGYVLACMFLCLGPPN